MLRALQKWAPLFATETTVLFAEGIRVSQDQCAKKSRESFYSRYILLQGKTCISFSIFPCNSQPGAITMRLL